MENGLQKDENETPGVPAMEHPSPLYVRVAFMWDRRDSQVRETCAISLLILNVPSLVHALPLKLGVG